MSMNCIVRPTSNRGLLIYAVLLTLGFAPRLLADDVPEIQPADDAPEYGLTGNWGGLRDDLANRGVLAGGFFILDASKNFMGGIDTEKTPLRYTLGVNLDIDAEKLFNWKGASFYFEFENHEGPSASDRITGDLMAFDNYDSGRFAQIYELYYQQMLLDDKLKIKIGKMDVSCDFSVMDHGMEFINSSMAYPLTIFALPTYPDPAPGAEIFYDWTDSFYTSAGVFYSNQHDKFLDFSGRPESCRSCEGGLFLIGETGYKWRLGDLPGHVGVGVWHHTGQIEHLNDSADPSDGAFGYYAFVDQTLLINPDNGIREVGVFANLGHSDPNVSPIDWQLVAGVAATGLIPARPDDVCGVAFAWAGLDEYYEAEHDSEWSLETFYKISFTPFASLKADLQYIGQPGGSLDDALVATLRFEVDF